MDDSIFPLVYNRKEEPRKRNYHWKTMKNMSYIIVYHLYPGSFERNQQWKKTENLKVDCFLMIMALVLLFFQCWLMFQVKRGWCFRWRGVDLPFTQLLFAFSLRRPKITGPAKECLRNVGMLCWCPGHAGPPPPQVGKKKGCMLIPNHDKISHSYKTATEEWSIFKWEGT